MLYRVTVFRHDGTVSKAHVPTLNDAERMAMYHASMRHDFDDVIEFKPDPDVRKVWIERI